MSNPKNRWPPCSISFFRLTWHWKVSKNPWRFRPEKKNIPFCGWHLLGTKNRTRKILAHEQCPIIKTSPPSFRSPSVFYPSEVKMATWIGILIVFAKFLRWLIVSSNPCYYLNQANHIKAILGLKVEAVGLDGPRSYMMYAAFVYGEGWCWEGLVFGSRWNEWSREVMRLWKEMKCRV